MFLPPMSPLHFKEVRSPGRTKRALGTQASRPRNVRVRRRPRLLKGILGTRASRPRTVWHKPPNSVSSELTTNYTLAKDGWTIFVAIIYRDKSWEKRHILPNKMLFLGKKWHYFLFCMQYIWKFRSFFVSLHAHFGEL